MRPRRFLLVTKALSAASLVAACGKESTTTPPLPGNPKGSTYDRPPPSATTLGGAPPKTIPPPGNPKGAHYDAGGPKLPPKQ